MKYKTYASLREAFRYGSGDRFFSNKIRTKFIAIHRREFIKYCQLCIDGFTQLNPDEALEIAIDQHKKALEEFNGGALMVIVRRRHDDAQSEEEKLIRKQQEQN